MGLYILKVSFNENTKLHHEHFTITSIYFYFILAREILPLWDKQIQSICYQVNSVIEKIGTAEPEWMAKTLDEEMAN